MLFFLAMIACSSPPETKPAPEPAVEAPRVVKPPAAASLVCHTDKGALAVVDTVTGTAGEALPAPPAGLTALEGAGKLLVGVTNTGAVVGLDGGAWRELRPASPEGASVLRARPVKDGALLWLRGEDPGTVPGALLVGLDGAVSQLDFQTANARASIWGAARDAVSGPPAGSAMAPDVAAAVAAAGITPAKDLTGQPLFDEPSPWGGRLLGLHMGYSGDWPSGPVVWTGGGAPVVLVLDGKPLDFQGPLSYGSDGTLLVDGAFSGMSPGVILVAKGGAARALAGLAQPCTWWDRG